ncbi:PRC-barrel domain-containing protein [Plastoroseomonas arctica]|uniref:PRC-barrel domain containing protein n=1 Tax=Plastoroseomonas arctica TaxID=1509237 RepID=A0AAF1JZK0_9PROT|nr:PRC-barrel domain-containing protein [Plastoroseomonas arctica]MBR0654393.1 PRC-barrel domain containing protein [Plastoroseomonas arctica]
MKSHRKISTSKRSIILPATLVAGMIAAPMLAFSQTAPGGANTNPPPAASPANPAPAAPGTAGTTARPTTTTTTTTATSPGTVTGTPTNRASRIIGANVHNERNETIGEIEDLIINASGGAPTAILSVGGFLGIGARLVAVPLSELSFNTERERWMLNGATKESLQARPAYTYQSRS